MLFTTPFLTITALICSFNTASQRKKLETQRKKLEMEKIGLQGKQNLSTLPPLRVSNPAGTALAQQSGVL